MKGPKTILAEAIAKALAEFFVVDQQAMETKLLGDAAVKLHNTQLQPREFSVGGGTVGSVLGVVKYVAFEWHWGQSKKEGGSDWVNHVRLTIRGLDFTIKLDNTLPQEEGKEEHEAPPPPQNEAGNKPSGGWGGYIQEQVERIMDTLTLSVQDVSLKIELPDGSQLQLGGHGVELTSKGRRSNGEPLLQDLDIQRLFISVLLPLKNLDTNTITHDSYPLLEDISYKAKTVRLFGSRFLSRFDRGMEVVGESNDQGVVVHIGEQQLQVMEALVGLLLANPASSSSSSKALSSNIPIGAPSIGVHNDQGSNVVLDTESSISSDDEDATTTSDKTEFHKLQGQPTYIMLPLAGVSLVLPNKTKICLTDIYLKYQMDGTTMSVEGKHGINVNGHPSFALGETSIWIADMVTKQFRVEDTAVPDQTADQDNMDTYDEDVVVFLHGRSAEIKALSEGLFQAMGIHRRFRQSVVGTTTRQSVLGTTTTASSKGASPQIGAEQTAACSWSLQWPGKVGCLYEQEGSDIEVRLSQVEASLDNMLMTIGRIEQVRVPGILQLADPIDNATFQYDGAALSMRMEDVVIILAEKKTESDTTSETNASPESTATTKPAYSLPCGFHLDVDKLLAFKPGGKSVHTTVDSLVLKADPIEMQSDQTVGDSGNTHVSLSVRELNHDMIRLKETSLVASLVLFSDYETISLFQFGAKEVHVAAGYSLANWKALLPKGGRGIEKKPFKLPYCHVHQMRVGVLVKSNLVGVNETVLKVKEFTGEKTTTSKDLMQFYNKEVISKVPGMVVNTQVLGTNVGDNVVGTLGNLLGAASGGLLGGAGGGFVSVAAFDGIKNTIKEGKVSRGVDEADDWQISDLANGVKYAAFRATRQGAARRGKSEDEAGDAIDWAVGATDDVAKYADENKARLAGAGAGAVGFAYGFLLGGPVGAVVGGVAATAATQKTVETIEHATNTIRVAGATYTVHDENPGAKLHDDKIVFSGILLKRRDFLLWDWRAHYFILTKDALKYYTMSKTSRVEGTKSKEHDLFFSSADSPRKSLEFQSNFVGSNGSLSKPKDNLFVFTIHSLEQAEPLWVLGAPSEADRSEWLSKLSEVMASNNDKRMSRVSCAAVDTAKEEHIRESPPPEIRDLVD